MLVYTWKEVGSGGAQELKTRTGERYHRSCPVCRLIRRHVAILLPVRVGQAKRVRVFRAGGAKR